MYGDVVQRMHAEVESDSNLPRYVDECVQQTRIPGKFRTDLESMGIKFAYTEQHYVESGVKVVLPTGFSLKRNGNCLCLLNRDAQCVFKARVADCRGFQTWTREK